jgi:hypothetical protein
MNGTAKAVQNQGSYVYQSININNQKQEQEQAQLLFLSTLHFMT